MQYGCLLEIGRLPLVIMSVVSCWMWYWSDRVAVIVRMSAFVSNVVWLSSVVSWWRSGRDRDRIDWTSPSCSRNLPARRASIRWYAKSIVKTVLPLFREHPGKLPGGFEDGWGKSSEKSCGISLVGENLYFCNAVASLFFISMREICREKWWGYFWKVGELFRLGSGDHVITRHHVHSCTRLHTQSHIPTHTQLILGFCHVALACGS